MVLSKREKSIAVALVATLSLLVVDRFALTPYVDRRGRVTMERAEIEQDLGQATRTFRRERQAREAWVRSGAGAPQSSPSEAQSQVLHALRDWAQEAGITLSSLKPQSTTREQGFVRIAVVSTGTGSMASAAKLLWRLESSGLPLRIGNVQMTSRKDGMDDLQLNFSVSTLCEPPSEQTATGAAPAASKADAP